MAAVIWPRQFTVRLVKRQWLAPDIIEFCCTRPANLDFAQGQFLQFVTNGAKRDYTLVSAPDAPTLDFCLKVRPKGRFSKTILEATPGHPFHISGPYGHFTCRRSSNPSVFAATGTGIAPFVAFSRDRVGNAMLLHGVDSSDALIYQPIVQRAVERYIPCLGQTVENETHI